MKIKLTYLRVICAVMTALMMISFLAACNPGTSGTESGSDTAPEDVTDSRSDETADSQAADSGTEQDSVPYESESAGETDTEDVPDTTLGLCGNGITACIILPDRPALWEESAADTLNAYLKSLSGAILPVIRASDADTSTSYDAVIHIGPTGQDVPDENDVGTAGYSVSVNGKSLSLYATSEAGMSDALDTVSRNLTVSDGTVTVDLSLNVTEAKYVPVVEPVVLSGVWGNTISYANGIANQLNGRFTSGDRSGYDVKNATMELIYDLEGTDTKRVTGFYNSNGVPYLTDSMDVFMKTADGQTFFASKSSTDARVNTYRLGYYYRDVHILDQNFNGGNLTYDPETTFSLLNKRTHWDPYMVSRPEIDSETYGITFYVDDSTDPYLSFTTSLDPKQYNALRVVMRTEVADWAEIFINNGSGFNAAQHVEFDVIPGPEFHEYLVMLNTMQDYMKGRIGAIRFDVGDVIGEKIEIAAVYAASVSTDAPQFNLDRTYHAYSDKLHEELHFVSVGETDDLAAYGEQTVLDAASVKSICVVDANGTHTSLSDVDPDTVRAAAFDIDRAGIIGWILPGDSREQLTVTESDGKYTVTFLHNEPESVTYHHGDEFSVGYRLYNDESHSFDGFLHEVRVEQNPLTMDITKPSDSSKVIGYNSLRGCYEYQVNGTGFTYAYNNPQKQFTVHGCLENDSETRKLYVMTADRNGCLENAVILNENNLLLPISPEVCKNFCGEFEEPLYYPSDAQYSESFIPMILKPDETRYFTVLHLFQNWGIYPLKQLSSIQFVSPYYHLSCGTTETNCIAPYFVFGKDYWTLPDFRAMSAPLWDSQPQHDSVGRLYWLQYTDSDGHFYGSDFTDDTIDSSGPVYADVSMEYLSDDGKIAVTYRHLETPQTDENRTYYEIDMTVLHDLSLNDFKNDFSFFSFDGRGLLFGKMGYLNQDGEQVTENTDLTQHSRIIKLGAQAPYFDYWEGNAGGHVCFALLVRDAEFVIGGESVNPGFVIKESYYDDNNHCALSLDLDSVTLKSGDTLRIRLILLPWGTRYSTDDGNVRRVRVDSCINPLSLEVITGSAVADYYMPKIIAENNVAEFRLSEGGGRMSVRVYGLTGYGIPKLEENVNGKWVPLSTNHYDYDGYMVYYDNDGTYSVSFIVETDQSKSVAYRVTGGNG